MKHIPLLVTVVLIAGSTQLCQAQFRYRYRTANRRGRDYALFVLQAGYMTYVAAGADPTVWFGYSYANLPGNYTYTSTAHVPSSGCYTNITSFGGEFGRQKGISALLLFGRSTNSVATLHHFEFAIGYNIKLSDAFSLHPSIAWCGVDTNVDFPDAIDNKDKDLLVLGQTFPYHTTYKVRGQVYDHYSAYTNVGLEDSKNGVALQCELRTSPLRRLVAGFTVGCAWYDHEKLKVTLESNTHYKDFSYDDPSLHFSSTISSQRFFDYNGFYLRFSLSYCYARDPIRPRRIHYKLRT